MRFLVASFAILAVTPVAAVAQWTVTVQGGMHADRLSRPQRILENGSVSLLPALRIGF